MSDVYRPDAAALAKLREGVAFGLLNVCYAVEAAAKRDCPVRGAHRSFRRGQPPIGGTLRRSIHSLVLLDGDRIAGSRSADENGEAVPVDYEGGPKEIVGYIGTNAGYGAYVELGTVKMAARPFLEPATVAVAGDVPGLIRAGMTKHLGG